MRRSAVRRQQTDAEGRGRYCENVEERAGLVAAAVRLSSCCYRFTYVLVNPFRVFVTVNEPSRRAEILM